MASTLFQAMDLTPFGYGMNAIWPWNENPRRHSYTKVARGHILKSDTALVEVVFDEAIPKGTYLLTLYTRSGRGRDFKVVHCRSEVSVK